MSAVDNNLKSIFNSPLGLILFPSILPLMTHLQPSRSIDVSLIRFLTFIVHIRALSSPIVSNTYSFIMFHPADFPYFPACLHFEGLCPSCLLFAWSLISLTHKATHSISVSLSSVSSDTCFPLSSSLVFNNASFPIAILLLISLWHLLCLPSRQAEFLHLIVFYPYLDAIYIIYRTEFGS